MAHFRFPSIVFGKHPRWWLRLILLGLFALGVSPRSYAALETVPGNSLCDAAKRGDLAAVTALLDGGLQVDTRNAEGRTALMMAATNRHLDVVTFLLERGADFNALSGHREKRGSHVLTWAVGGGDLEIVKLLLDRGAKLNVRGTTGRSPLGQAVIGRFPAMVQLLLDRGADINFPGMEYTPGEKGEEPRLSVPLLVAAHEGATEIAELLLKKGAAVDSEDSHGDSALMFAARTGQRAMVDLLIEKGADVNHQGINGHTALIYGAYNGYVGIVAALLKAGAKQSLLAHNRYGGEWGSAFGAESCAREQGHVLVADMLMKAR
jgi:ankyrin repeat protein